MRRIILFRFHDSLEVCANRLELLHRFNPGSTIIGLWGGNRAGLPAARQALASRLEHIWEVPVESPHWKWQNADLVLQLWHRHEGWRVPFDVLYLFEWDMLVLASLDQIYGDAGRNGLAMTGLTPMERVQHTWYWTTAEPYATHWRQLQGHVRERYGWNGPHFACHIGGGAFSKAFLDRYALEDVPALGNDELRLPLFAQAMGFPLQGLPHIYREIMDPTEMEFFNCEKMPIQEDRIRAELRSPAGRRVFHPYRGIFRVD